MKVRIGKGFKLLSLVLVGMITLGIFNEVYANETWEETKKSRSQQIETLNKDLNVITSDRFKGRLAGTKENEEVAKYIEGRYRECGLAPFNGNSFFHEYSQEVYYPDQSEHYMNVIFEDGSKKEYIYGKDFIDYIRATNLKVECEIINKNDVRSEDLKEARGDIAVLLEKEELTRELLANNVKAIINKTDEFVGVPFVANTKRANIQVSEECYKELVEKKAKKVSLKSVYKTELKSLKNVIGKIEGSSKKDKKAIVISAHFDHVGWDGKTIFPGAVDNGSGTIAVMNIAEKLKAAKLLNDIYICAFNGEEYGLFGSKAFARHIKGIYDETIVINIDCIGKVDGKKLGIHGEKIINDDLKKDISKILSNHKIDNYEDDVPNSDHSSFIYENMFAISLIQDNLFNKGKAIHTKNDDEKLVDCSYIYRICDAVVDYIETFDKSSYIKEEE